MVIYRLYSYTLIFSYFHNSIVLINILNKEREVLVSHLYILFSSNQTFSGSVSDKLYSNSFIWQNFEVEINKTDVSKGSLEKLFFNFISTIITVK